MKGKKVIKNWRKKKLGKKKLKKCLLQLLPYLNTNMIFILHSIILNFKSHFHFIYYL